MLDFPFSVNFKSFPIFCLSYCLALPFFYSSEEVTKSKDCCLMCPETQTEIVNNIINYTYLSGCILDLNRMSTCFLFFSLSLVYLCAGVRRFFSRSFAKIANGLFLNHLYIFTKKKFRWNQLVACEKCLLCHLHVAVFFRYMLLYSHASCA